MKHLVFAASLLLLSGTPTARAEVLNADASGFSLETTLELTAPPDRVFDALTGEIDLWWHPDHTFSGDASRLFMDPRAGGIFGERLPDGGSVRHLDVLFHQPGVMLRLGGGLGPLQGMAVSGVMTFALHAAPSGTRLELTYDVAGRPKDGLADLAGPVDGVLVQQMERLRNHLEE